MEEIIIMAKNLAQLLFYCLLSAILLHMCISLVMGMFEKVFKNKNLKLYKEVEKALQESLEEVLKEEVEKREKVSKKSEKVSNEKKTTRKSSEKV